MASFIKKPKPRPVASVSKPILVSVKPQEKLEVGRHVIPEDIQKHIHEDQAKEVDAAEHNAMARRPKEATKYVSKGEEIGTKLPMDMTVKLATNFVNEKIIKTLADEEDDFEAPPEVL